MAKLSEQATNPNPNPNPILTRSNYCLLSYLLYLLTYCTYYEQAMVNASNVDLALMRFEFLQVRSLVITPT